MFKAALKNISPMGRQPAIMLVANQSVTGRNPQLPADGRGDLWALSDFLES